MPMPTVPLPAPSFSWCPDTLAAPHRIPKSLATSRELSRARYLVGEPGTPRPDTPAFSRGVITAVDDLAPEWSDAARGAWALSKI